MSAPAAAVLDARVALGAGELGLAFPFHFAFDRTLRVVQVGEALQRVAPAFVPGASLHDLVQLWFEEPAADFEAIAARANQLAVVHVGRRFPLRGQFLRPAGAGGDVLLFLGSPWFTDADAMHEAGVRLQDFAPHEAIGDLMLLLQTQRAALADARQLAERLHAQRAALGLQYEVTRILAEPVGVEQATQMLLARVAGFFGGQVATLWLREGEALACRGIWHAPDERLTPFVWGTRGFLFAAGEGLPGRVWASGKPLWVDDVTQDPQFARAALAAESGLHGGFAFPVVLGGEVVGVIEAFRVEHTPPQPATLELLAAIGLQVGQYLERRRAEGERERLRAFYEQVLNALPAQLAVFDLVGRFRYLTPSAVPNLELRTWLIGRTERHYCELRGWDPAIGEARLASLRRAVETRGVTSYEERLITRTGEERHFLRMHSPILDDAGEVVQVLGYGLDITDRVNAEARLEESEQRYRSVVQTVGEVVFQTDAEGHWTFLNPAWARITGWSVEESLGQPFVQYVHPDDRERNWELFKPLVEGHKEYCRHRIRYLTRDGGFRWIEVYAFLAKDGEGRTIGTAGTLMDVTEATLAEQELTQARQGELATGAKLQEIFLQGRPPADLPDADVAGVSYPSQGIDGDFLDFFQPRGSILDVVVGDPMGKGVPAALLGAATKSRFLRALLSAEDDGGPAVPAGPPGPAEVVAAVHDEVTHQLQDLGSFVTLCYARFDFIARHVQIVDCGHPPTLHLSRAGGAPERLSGDDMPLGFPASARFGERVVPFAGGDVFVLYSDGLIEAPAPDGERFGLERLEALLAAQAARGAHALSRCILDAVRDFTGGAPLRDDLTLAVVRIKRVPAMQDGAGTLRLPVGAAALPRVRDFVLEIRDQLAEPGAATGWADDLALAATEVVTNILKHDQGCAAFVRLTSHREGDRLVLRISHDGAAFEPGDILLPDIADLPEGGFGLYLIRQTMDEVRWELDETGLAGVTLVKHLPAGTAGTNRKDPRA